VRNIPAGYESTKRNFDAGVSLGGRRRGDGDVEKLSLTTKAIRHKDL
jgi:hypothetical protein